MKPSIAVDITARDRTGPGQKAAERGFGGFAKKTDGLARQSGFARLEKQAKGFASFARSGFGLDASRRDLSEIASLSARLGGGLANATEKLTSFNAASSGGLTEAVSGIAKAGGVIGLGIAGTTAAAAGVYMVGTKFADMGAGIGRTAASLGQSAQDLQAVRAAAERAGVQVGATDSSLESLGDTLHDARFGGNNLALGVLSQLGLKLKTTKDGGVDVTAMLYDIADAIAKIADPQTQKRVASLFGLTGMLPALRKGSGALRQDAAAFTKSGAALSPSEIDQASGLYHDATAFRQETVGAVTRAAGAAAMGGARTEMAAMGQGLAALRTGLGAAPKAFGDLEHAARDLTSQGFHVAQKGAQDFAGAAGKATEALEGVWTKATRGFRDNNPGNLRRPGQTSGFAHYDDMQQGLAAMGRQLRIDQHRHGLNTIGQIVNRYAPPSENDTAAYVARVAKETGWAPDRKLNLDDPKELAKLERAMIGVEQGQQPFTAQQIERAVKVEVTFKNAPAGMVARATSDQGVAVTATVARAMEGP